MVRLKHEGVAGHSMPHIECQLRWARIVGAAAGEPVAQHRSQLRLLMLDGLLLLWWWLCLSPQWCTTTASPKAQHLVVPQAPAIHSVAPTKENCLLQLLLLLLLLQLLVLQVLKGLVLWVLKGLVLSEVLRRGGGTRCGQGHGSMGCRRCRRPRTRRVDPVAMCRALPAVHRQGQVVLDAAAMAPGAALGLCLALAVDAGSA